MNKLNSFPNTQEEQDIIERTSTLFANAPSSKINMNFHLPNLIQKKDQRIRFKENLKKCA